MPKLPESTPAVATACRLRHRRPCHNRKACPMKGRCVSSLVRLLGGLWSAAAVGPVDAALRRRAAADAAGPFDAHIGPLVARRCLGCHNASARKGGLELSHAKGAK